MNRCLRFRNGVLFVALCATMVGAELQWAGSYENTLDGLYLSGEKNILDENRLRIDMNASFGSAVSFTGDIVFRKFFGTVRYDYADFLPEHIAHPFSEEVMALFGDTGSQEMAFAYRDTLYVDNAAVTLEKKRTLLTVGIQQLPWGSGYAWNPTDLWNVKDILDPTYDKPGQAALKYNQGIGPVSVTAVAGFAEDYTRIPWTLTLSSTVGGFDFTALGAYRATRFQNELYGTGKWYRDRYCAGYSFSGQLGGIGVHSEGGWNRELVERSFTRQYAKAREEMALLQLMGVDTVPLASDHAYARNYFQVVAGADYTIGIGNGLYIMGEYFFNGDGKERSEDYSIEDWSEYLSGENLTLGQHTVFAGISYSITDLSTLALYAVGNLSDRSAALNPWLTISITDDCELDISGAVPLGGDEDEFGRKQYMGRARIKVYW